MVYFMGSVDGPKNGPELVIFVINSVVRHGISLDTFIDLSKREMCRLQIVSNSDYKDKRTDDME
jgi:hypothetical protein